MLNMTEKREGNLLTLALEGRSDTNTAPTLQSAVNPLPDGVTHIVLDFEKVDYISSGGMRMLLTVAQAVDGKGGAVKLIHVNEYIRDVFDITGFVDILTIL